MELKLCSLCLSFDNGIVGHLVDPESFHYGVKIPTSSAYRQNAQLLKQGASVRRDGVKVNK